MPPPNYGMADLGLMMVAFFGWWFWIICAIVARRVSYVVWAFWWAALMWWLAVVMTPNDAPLSVVLTWRWLGLLLVVIWPLRAAYKRLYLEE